MSVKLAPGCYWRGPVIWGRFKLAGRQYRRSLLTANPGEAKIRYSAWRKKVERTEVGLEPGHTFKAAVVKWAREVLPTTVKPQVMRRYLTSISVLDPVFGHMAIAAIDTKTISRYISSRSGTVTNATIRRDLTALSHLLMACISWGWISDNPARTFDRRIIRQQVKTLVIPSDDEFETTLASAPAGMALILRMLDATGMRENEAVTLEHGDIDAEREQIRLSKTKTNRPRVLRWKTPGGDAGAVLAALPAARGTILIPNRDGAAYASFSSDYGNLMRRVVAAEKKAARPFRRFRAHDLRHRFAIRWLKAGGDLYRLSRHLGHSSVKTTEGYLRELSDDEDDRVRGVIAVVTSGVTEPGMVED